MILPSTPQLLILFGVTVLLFGGNRIPKIGGAIGEALRNFKKGIKPDEPPQGKLKDPTDSNK